MKQIYCLLLLILVTSCAKIPMQSIDLADITISEGQRMHQLNTTLINQLFQSKSKAIDVFIDEVFTPQFLNNFEQSIPDNINVRKELPDIIKATSLEINHQRNTMQAALEENRIKLITKLEEDFEIFQTASFELKKLLASAVKVDQSWNSLLQRFNSLAGNKMDISAIGRQIDSFILKAGVKSAKITDLTNDLNNSINTLIK